MTTYSLTRTELERDLDIALAGSFPASDPPPWTFGVSVHTSEPASVPRAGVAPWASDVVIAGGRGRRRAASVLEAMAMTALVPVGVLAIAAPFLLLVWGVVAAATWLLGGR